MAQSKRKYDDDHYDTTFNEYDDYDKDNDYNMIKVNQITRDFTHKQTKKSKFVPEICNICYYGKLNNLCRCSLNCDIQILDNIEIKTCVFCTDLVSVCQCSAILWAMFQCNLCKITHSIYYECAKITKETECELCYKYNNYTQNGCRCMHYNMKYVLSDINLKSINTNTDYAHAFDKEEFQTVCIQCSQHISNCNCLKEHITDE